MTHQRSFPTFAHAPSGRSAMDEETVKNLRPVQSLSMSSFTFAPDRSKWLRSSVSMAVHPRNIAVKSSVLEVLRYSSPSIIVSDDIPSIHRRVLVGK